MEVCGGVSGRDVGRVTSEAFTPAAWL
jgi:hypothetical protein